MNKNVILPIIVSLVIIAAGMFIYVGHYSKQDKINSLTIIYKDNKINKTELTLGQSFKINNIIFSINSTNPDKILFFTSEKINNEDEFEVLLNEEKIIKFEDGSQASIMLE